MGTPGQWRSSGLARRHPGEIDRELTDAQRAALPGASKVAVSLEPDGGAATGAPTGPVLFVADRVKRA